MDRAVITDNLKNCSGTPGCTGHAEVALLGVMTLPMPPPFCWICCSPSTSLFPWSSCCVYLRIATWTSTPSLAVLLVATLLRLALNVASTRVVLLHGHEGGDAAGKVIEAFGEVVIGGNYAVGMVRILMIINFSVGLRVQVGYPGERTFPLDAMPGKQMAIDADLNAGIIEQDETNDVERIATEADFYGSMDGATKFVKGDAVAGFLILFINIGGLIIGMVQRDLEFSDALQKYVLLTIGDGLVAQIPSLLLSVAAAILA